MADERDEVKRIWEATYAAAFAGMVRSFTDRHENAGFPRPSAKQLDVYHLEASWIANQAASRCVQRQARKEKQGGRPTKL